MEYNKEVRNKPGRRLTTSSPRDVRRRQQHNTDNEQLIQGLRQELESLRSVFSTSTGGLTPEKVDEEIRKAVKDAVKETKAYYEPLLADAKSKEEALRGKLRELKESSGNAQVEFKKQLEKSAGNARAEIQERYNSKISSLEDKLKLAEDKIADREAKIDALKEEKETAISRILDEQNRKLEELAKHISLEKTGVDDPDRPAMEETFVDPLDKDSGSDLETHIKLEDLPSDKKEAMASKVNKLKDLMGSFADKED
jgi:hypothetical protein